MSDSIDYKALARMSLHYAQLTDDPDNALAWLKVAAAWQAIQPPDAPAAPDGFCKLGPLENEATRVIIRLAENGHNVVIVDPKFRNAFGGHTNSAAAAATLAMLFLDKLAKLKEQEAKAKKEKAEAKAKAPE